MRSFNFFIISPTSIASEIVSANSQSTQNDTSFEYLDEVQIK